MKLGLFELLFKAELSREEGPLFKSHTDLAKAVIAVKKGFEGKSNDNVRSFISQVFSTKRMYKRKISPKLKNSILAAVKQRLSNSLNYQEVIDEFGKAFRDLDEPGSVELPLDAADEFDALLEDSEKAKLHYITTYIPAESKKDSIRAAELRLQLLRRVGLIDEGSEDISLNQKVQYIFNFPKYEIAKLFWQQIIASRDVGSNNSNVIDKLLDWDKNDNSPLMVYIQDPVYCVFPCVVYNPELSPPYSTGYIFYYHHGSRISVARIPGEAIVKWQELIYLPSITDSSKFGRKRVLFSESKIKGKY